MSRKHNSQSPVCEARQNLSLSSFFFHKLPSRLGVRGYVKRFKWHLLCRGRQIIKSCGSTKGQCTSDTGIWSVQKEKARLIWALCPPYRGLPHLFDLDISPASSSLFTGKTEKSLPGNVNPGDPPGSLQSTCIWPAPLTGGERGMWGRLPRPYDLHTSKF